MTSFGFNTTGQQVVEAFSKEINSKTVVITGTSNGGLGAQTATDLARGGPALIFLLARSQQKVQPVIDQIKDVNSSVVAKFVPIELDNVSSVNSAAEEINTQAKQIDVLINNAGIMAVPYSKSELDVENHLATNHLGHFLLTKLLMPKILAAGSGSRIVNVTSDGYELSKFRFDDPNFSDGATYNKWAGYGQSKTANILFTVSLASKLADRGIRAYTIHPGVIMTTSLSSNIDDFAAEIPDIQRVAMEETGTSFNPNQPKTPEQGVSTTIRAALDPELNSHSGTYLVDCQIHPIRDYASSKENAEKLWRWSEQVLGEKFEL